MLTPSLLLVLGLCSGPSMAYISLRSELVRLVADEAAGLVHDAVPASVFPEGFFDDLWGETAGQEGRDLASTATAATFMTVFDSMWKKVKAQLEDDDGIGPRGIDYPDIVGPNRDDRIAVVRSDDAIIYISQW